MIPELLFITIKRHEDAQQLGIQETEIMSILFQ